MLQQYFVVVLLCLCAIAAKPTSNSDKDAVVTEYVNENDHRGNYVYGFAIDNGIEIVQKGKVKIVDDTAVVVVTGIISYVDPDGEEHTYKYTADENGFRIAPYEIIRSRIGGNVIASLVGGGVG